MSLLPLEQPHFEELTKVIELYVQRVNPTQIARKLELRRVDVLNYIDEWKQTAIGSDVMRDRVEELMASTDEHYTKLIRSAYEVIEEVDAVYEEKDDEALEKFSRKWGTMSRAQMLSQKMSAIKTIADLETKRIDMLQKAGLLEAADFGDQLAAFEEEKQFLKDVLKEHLCESCSKKVRVALAGRHAEDVVFSS